MSLARTIGKGTLWLSLSSIAVKAVGLLSVFIILSQISVYSYGLIELALGAVSLLTIFALPGLTDVVIADMSKLKSEGRKGEMRELLWNHFKLQSILSAFAFIILFVGADIISSYYEGNITTLIKILSFNFLISPLRSLTIILLSVYQRFFEKSLFGFFEEVSKLILILTLFALYEWGEASVVSSMVFNQAIVVLGMSPVIYSIYKDIRGKSVEHKSPFWSHLQHHGKWSVFSSSLNGLGPTIRLFMIRFFLGTEAVGLFAVAHGLYNNTSSLLTLSGVLAPIFPQYVSSKDLFYKIARKAIKYQLIIFILLGIIAAALFPPILTILFPQYAFSMDLYRVLLFTLIPASFAVVITPMYFALKAQKSLFGAIAYKTLLIIILSPICISLFGIWGVPIEFILTAILFVVERYRVIKKQLPDFKLTFRSLITRDEVDDLILNKVNNSFLGKFMARSKNNL